HDLTPVFIHRYRRGHAAPVDENETALCVDDDTVRRAHLRDLRPVVVFSLTATFTTSASTATRPGRVGDEVHAKQVGHTGVVVEPEFVFLRFFVDAGAAPDHLVELDGRLQ